MKLQNEEPTIEANEFHDSDSTNKAYDKKTGKFEEWPIKIGKKKLEVQDPLIEFNLGSNDDN